MRCRRPFMGDLDLRHYLVCSLVASRKGERIAGALTVKGVPVLRLRRFSFCQPPAMANGDAAVHPPSPLPKGTPRYS